MTPNEIKELEVQENVIRHVDDFKSFRFNAGAGAGKTYALIETLKYIAINKIIATKSPQKVVCITYTNVAVNEIKSRLGSSDSVYVSTIHERLWAIIKGAQPQLLICHKEKIIEVLEKNKQELLNPDKAKFFINLNDRQQKEFISYIMQTKDIFYRSKKLSANIFKESYKKNNEIDNPIFLDQCLNNVGVFKYIVRILYKNQKLEECLDKINSKQETRVEYDSQVNTDRLHYMKFSHDTLLEYGLKLVRKYPTLCRIIIDNYPYFFIDEYQDAHSNVIEFVKVIHDYALKNNKKWMVGYFGDTAQCIYEDGVGRDITILHDGLGDINKIFNRRSHQQIINVANNIRSDEIVQIPIDQERKDGSVTFYYHTSPNDFEVAKKFLYDYKMDLANERKLKGHRSCDNEIINCLVLTNSLLAMFNEFDDVYQVYKSSAIYYDNLNNQVLSKQLDKLHPTILIIYKLVQLYLDIQKGEVSFHDIFGVYSEEISFSMASLVIRELKNKEISTLGNWLELITTLLKCVDIKEPLMKLLINFLNCEKDKVASADIFNSTMLENINDLMNDSTEDDEVAKEKVSSILSLPMTSLINWSNFIYGIKVDDVIYHTYHGAKGEEYDNVAIILEHSFGRINQDKFKNYFTAIQKDEKGQQRLLSDEKIKEKHINTKNLLYVACSRAKKNLRVLYLDDISDIQKGVEAIFGPSKRWVTETEYISR